MKHLIKISPFTKKEEGHREKERKKEREKETESHGNACYQHQLILKVVMMHKL